MEPGRLGGRATNLILVDLESARTMVALVAMSRTCPRHGFGTYHAPGRMAMQISPSGFGVATRALFGHTQTG